MPVRAAAGFAGVIVAASGYLVSGRHRRYGATPAEVAGVLPGDDLVPAPASASTRAITIDAPPERVWPWLVQLGQGRAGFYTYTWLENLAGCHLTNADAINPEWQGLRVGDEVRLHPDLALRVMVLDPGRALVIAPPSGEAPSPAMDFDFSWAFVLAPGPDQRGTRLLIRERYHPYGGVARASVAAGQLMSAVMTFGMLRGIRARAVRPSGPPQPSDPALPSGRATG